MGVITIERRDVNDVVILQVSGEITYGKGSDVVLRTTVDTVIAEGMRKLILNVSGVTYVDSAGLGQLAQIQTQAGRSQVALRLASLSKRLRELLLATRLLPLFQVYETEAEALASLDGAVI
jgi:anti-sigma B factor antagonist